MPSYRSFATDPFALGSHADGLRVRWWLLVPWSLCLLWLAGCTSVSTLTGEEVGASIQARYESELFTLTPGRQRHYAQRLYRITGDDKYLPINELHAKRLILSLREEIEGLASADHARSRSREMIEAYPTRTEKQRERRAMLSEWDDIIFARSLLYRLIQLEDYRLLDTPLLAGHERVLDYLASVDFTTFLTDPEVLTIYSAQVANITYFLHQLGILDVRDEVEHAFRSNFPRERVATLSNHEYRNRIYGMTHFVIAASRYYQQQVSAETFDWIFSSFEEELERILTETTEDIYTEVGISFLLAGLTDHPALVRIRSSLVAAYDPRARMIPTSDGGVDLERGGHRNVLAIMLLRWPEVLHPGPDLRNVQALVATAM